MKGFRDSVQNLKEIAALGATYDEKLSQLKTAEWVEFGKGVRALFVPMPWRGFDLTFIESDAVGFFPSEDTQGSTHYKMHHTMQWFYCIDGSALIEVDGVNHSVNTGDSLHIPAGAPIRIVYYNCKALFRIAPGNAETQDIEFL